MDGKWSILDERMRELVQLDSKAVTIQDGVVKFKRPNKLWFYNKQKITLYRETLDTLTDVSVCVNGITKDSRGELIVDCSVEDVSKTRNRRSELRRFVESTTLIYSNGPADFGTVIDLSKNGAKVELPNKMLVEVGNVFSLRFTADYQEMNRRGVVRWVLVEEDKVLIGLKFFE